MPVRYNILVADDIKSTAACLVEVFAENGWQTTAAYSGEEALAALSKQRFDLAVIDIKMTPMNGIELMRRIRDKDPKIPVIMMSAYHTIETAAGAVALDVFDILQKPFMLRDAVAMVKRALSYGVALNGALDLDLVVAPCKMRMGLVAESEAMRKTCHAAEQVAPTSASVLIVGEKGTGRSALAEAIHASSPRSAKPLLVLDASTQDAGAIHGRTAQLSQEERSGTVYVKELNRLGENEQRELARFLNAARAQEENGGAACPRFIASVDASAWKSGAALIAELGSVAGHVKLDVAPLRERPTDILPLTHHLLRRLSREDSQISMLDIEVPTILERYSWPGNVAEMEAIYRRIFETAGGAPDRISASMLPENMLREAGPIPPPRIEELKNEFLQGMKLRDFLASATKEEIQRISELVQSEGRRPLTRHLAKLHGQLNPPPQPSNGK